MSDLPIKVYAGTDAICQIVEAGPIDMVLTAMVGYAGLKPTINAIRAKKAIALANKETLVVAGELINQLAAKGIAVIMISSEMPEVLGISDRILVFSEGRITGELKREEFSQELVMQYATPHKEGEK